LDTPMYKCQGVVGVPEPDTPDTFLPYVECLVDAMSPSFFS
jgi:hypothetical protein